MGKTGHLTQPEIKEIVDNKKVSTLVETGTYLGDSTVEASKYFDTVHTIEIVPDLHEKAKAKCKGIENIVFHLGDTVQLLPKIVEDVKNSGCVWFLDAHQSGPETGNNGQWVPLLKELNLILDSIKDSTFDHIFVIDDVRLFSAHWDWAEVSIQSIEKCFVEHGISMKNKLLMNDRYIVYV
jgi:hypothetical protein